MNVMLLITDSLIVKFVLKKLSQRRIRLFSPSLRDSSVISYYSAESFVPSTTSTISSIEVAASGAASTKISSTA